MPASKRSSSSSSGGRKSSRQRYKVGDKVSAHYQGGKDVYGGKIEAVNKDGTYVILYDDGDREKQVKPEWIVNESPSSPAGKLSFKPGDRIMAYFHGDKRNQEYPGTIQRVNSNGTVDIEYDDGDSDKSIPSEMVRRQDPKGSPRKSSGSGKSSPSSSSTSTPPAEGDRVMCKYRGQPNGSEYPAVIVKVRGNKIDVDYDDGDIDRGIPIASARLVKKPTKQKKPPNETFKVGQKVVARFRGKPKGEEYAGQISKVRKDGTFDIKYDDGDVDQGLEAQFIRSASSVKPKGSKQQQRDSIDESSSGAEDEEVDEEEEEESDRNPVIVQIEEALEEKEMKPAKLERLFRKKADKEHEDCISRSNFQEVVCDSLGLELSKQDLQAVVKTFRKKKTSGQLVHYSTLIASLEATDSDARKESSPLSSSFLAMLQQCLKTKSKVVKKFENKEKVSREDFERLVKSDLKMKDMRDSQVDSLYRTFSRGAGFVDGNELLYFGFCATTPILLNDLVDALNQCRQMTQSSVAKLKELKKLFRKFDKEKTGFVDYKNAKGVILQFFKKDGDQSLDKQKAEVLLRTLTSTFPTEINVKPQTDSDSESDSSSDEEEEQDEAASTPNRRLSFQKFRSMSTSSSLPGQPFAYQHFLYLIAVPVLGVDQTKLNLLPLPFLECLKDLQQLKGAAKKKKLKMPLKDLISYVVYQRNLPLSIELLIRAVMESSTAKKKLSQSMKDAIMNNKDDVASSKKKTTTKFEQKRFETALEKTQFDLVELIAWVSKELSLEEESEVVEKAMQFVVQKVNKDSKKKKKLLKLLKLNEHKNKEQKSDEEDEEDDAEELISRTEFAKHITTLYPVLKKSENNFHLQVAIQVLDRLNTGVVKPGLFVSELTRNSTVSDSSSSSDNDDEDDDNDDDNDEDESESESEDDGVSLSSQDDEEKENDNDGSSSTNETSLINKGLRKKINVGVKALLKKNKKKKSVGSLTFLKSQLLEDNDSDGGMIEMDRVVSFLSGKPFTLTKKQSNLVLSCFPESSSDTISVDPFLRYLLSTTASSTCCFPSDVGLVKSLDKMVAALRKRPQYSVYAPLFDLSEQSFKTRLTTFLSSYSDKKKNVEKEVKKLITKGGDDEIKVLDLLKKDLKIKAFPIDLRKLVQTKFGVSQDSPVVPQTDAKSLVVFVAKQLSVKLDKKEIEALVSFYNQGDSDFCYMAFLEMIQPRTSPNYVKQKMHLLVEKNAFSVEALAKKAKSGKKRKVVTSAELSKEIPARFRLPMTSDEVAGLVHVLVGGSSVGVNISVKKVFDILDREQDDDSDRSSDEGDDGEEEDEAIGSRKIGKWFSSKLRSKKKTEETADGQDSSSSSDEADDDESDSGEDPKKSPKKRKIKSPTKRKKKQEQSSDSSSGDESDGKSSRKRRSPKWNDVSSMSSSSLSAFSPKGKKGSKSKQRKQHDFSSDSNSSSGYSSSDDDYNIEKRSKRSPKRKQKKTKEDQWGDSSSSSDGSSDSGDVLLSSSSTDESESSDNSNWGNSSRKKKKKGRRTSKAKYDLDDEEEYQRTLNKSLKKAFEICDSDNNGYVDAKELSRILLALHYELSSSQIRSTLDQFDENHDGKLNQKEFLKLMRVLLKKKQGRLTASREKQILETFQAIDTNKDGTVSKKEFVYACRHKLLGDGDKSGGGISESEALKLLRVADTDKDGSISYQEFLDLVRLVGGRRGASKRNISESTRKLVLKIIRGPVVDPTSYLRTFNKFPLHFRPGVMQEIDSSNTIENALLQSSDAVSIGSSASRKKGRFRSGSASSVLLEEEGVETFQIQLQQAKGIPFIEDNSAAKNVIERKARVCLYVEGKSIEEDGEISSSESDSEGDDSNFGAKGSRPRRQGSSSLHYLGNQYTLSASWNKNAEDIWKFSSGSSSTGIEVDGDEDNAAGVDDGKKNKFSIASSQLSSFIVRVPEKVVDTHESRGENVCLLIELTILLKVDKDPSSLPVEVSCGWCSVPLKRIEAATRGQRGEEDERASRGGRQLLKAQVFGGSPSFPTDIDNEEVLNRKKKAGAGVWGKMVRSRSGRDEKPFVVIKCQGMSSRVGKQFRKAIAALPQTIITSHSSLPLIVCYQEFREEELGTTGLEQRQQRGEAVKFEPVLRVFPLILNDSELLGILTKKYQQLLNRRRGSAILNNRKQERDRRRELFREAVLSIWPLLCTVERASTRAGKKKGNETKHSGSSALLSPSTRRFRKSGSPSTSLFFSSTPDVRAAQLGRRSNNRDEEDDKRRKGKEESMGKLLFKPFKINETLL